MAFVDCITRTRLTRQEKSLPLLWPVGRDRLSWELDDSQFTEGTVIVTIEVSWDGGLTFRQTKRTGFDFDTPRVDRQGTTVRYSGVHGPYRFGPGHHPTGGVIIDPVGEVVNPTHFKITLAPLTGNPRVGARVDL